jgi:hypothetical protein
MKRMMTTIADVDTNFAELSVENRMPCFTFHIIGWLIEIANSGNMPFFLFPKYVSMIINDDSSIMEGLLIFLSL